MRNNIVPVLVNLALAVQDQYQAPTATGSSDLERNLQRLFDRGAFGGVANDMADFVQAAFGFKPAVRANGERPKVGEVFRNKSTGQLFLVIDTKLNAAYQYGLGASGNYEYFVPNSHEIVRGDQARDFITDVVQEWSDRFLLSKLAAMGWQYLDSVLSTVEAYDEEN